MAKKIIQAQMQQRRDTAAQWAAKNPVLLDGELGVVTDNPNSYKIGDGVTAWNDLPLRGFDGNIVQTLGNSATAVMSQKAITEQVAKQNEKLAQLDQEFQAIKDANFNVLVNPHIEIVEPQGNVITIDSDKFYKWGEVANLAITFNAPSAPYVGSYIFQFTCPADAATSLAMPIEVVWNKTPLIEAGKTYQVSVVNNLAVITAWGNNEE